MIKQCDPLIPVSLNIPYVKDCSLFYTYNDDVYFSVSGRGDTLEAHIAATKKGKRSLRVAVNEFCDYMFKKYPSYNKIAANVKMKSVKNLCLKCGFEKLTEIQGCEVYVKWAI